MLSLHPLVISSSQILCCRSIKDFLRKRKILPFVIFWVRWDGILRELRQLNGYITTGIVGKEQGQEFGRILLEFVGRAKWKMSNRQSMFDLENTDAGFLRD